MSAGLNPDLAAANLSRLLRSIDELVKALEIQVNRCDLVKASLTEEKRQRVTHDSARAIAVVRAWHEGGKGA